MEKNSDGSFNVKIEAQDMKVATNIINKVCKTNNISEASKSLMLENLKQNTVPMNQVFKGEINFGGEKLGRSLVKTALAMTFYMGIEIHQCDLALEYLLENKEPCYEIFYSANKDFIKNRNNNIPFHCVHIKASSEQKRIFGYIEYFGAFRIILSLSSDYKGESKEESYSFDPINNQRLDLSVQLDTDDDEIKKIYNREIYDMAIHEEAIGSLMNKVVKKSQENNITNRINEAVQRWDNEKTYDENMRQAMSYLDQFFKKL